jgi:hypothetical protein
MVARALFRSPGLLHCWWGSEKRFNIPGTAYHPKNLDTVICGTIEDEVVAYWKAAEVWCQFRTAATQQGIFSKEKSPFPDQSDQTRCS